MEVRETKRMISVLAATVALFALAGCSQKITSGEVIGKQFTPAHTEVRLTPIVISNGKTTTTSIVPFTYYYPDTYTITISGLDKNGEQQAATYRVTEEVYDAVAVGSEFVYVDDMQPDSPEYTRERIDE